MVQEFRDADLRVPLSQQLQVTVEDAAVIERNIA